MEKLVKKHLGDLDILVCNVGSGKRPSLEKKTPEEWQRVFDLNLWSSITQLMCLKNIYLNQKVQLFVFLQFVVMNLLMEHQLLTLLAKSTLNAYIKFASKDLGNHAIKINAISPEIFYLMAQYGI